MPDLAALALNAADQLPVAELHGAVCGLAAGGGEAVPIEDLVALLGVDALTDLTSVEQFVEASLADLQAEDMTFNPLLADDEAALGERIESLGQWCASFLTGLAAGLARRGITSLDDCPQDVLEIVRDLAAISQVDDAAHAADAAGDAEAAETDLVELEEFVKVGALLIMNTLAATEEDGARHGADDPTD